MLQVATTGVAYFVVFRMLERAGLYATAPGEPARLLGIMVILFPLVVTIAYVAVRPFRRWVLKADLVEYVGLQTFRVVGAAFLFLMELGRLPAGFAVPAGWGDVLVGVLALLAVISLTRGSGSTAWLFWAVFVIGILDFVGAFASGNIVSLSGRWAPEFARMTEMPLLIVPGFLVPMWIVTHLYALFKYRAGGSESELCQENTV